MCGGRKVKKCSDVEPECTLTFVLQLSSGQAEKRRQTPAPISHWRSLVLLCYCGFFFFFTLHHNNKCRVYFCSADMYSSTFKNDLKQMKVPDDMKGSIVHVVNYTVIKHSLSIESYIWHRHSGWPFLTSLNFQRFFSMCLCVTSYHISLTANNRKRSPSTALLMPLSF